MRAGTYFISLLVFTTGVASSGTVTATVTGGGGGGGGTDLTGTWSWSASCSGSLFSGQFRINTQQANGTFTGDFLNTNSNDSGTINDGNINGSQVGFRRTIPGGVIQLWSGTLGSTLTGLRLDGTISQGGSLICTFSATRSGGGGGGGGASGTVDKIFLRGGSFSAGAFSFNGRVWDTDSTSGSWVLGLTSPGAGNPLLNAANKSVNLPVPPNNYWIHNDPTGGGYQGAAVQVTVHWSDGRPDDVATFSVGDFASTAP